MDYESLSDFEVNKLVATAQGYDICDTEIHGDSVECMSKTTPFGIVGYFDYCDRPEDAWHIITENNISIIHIPIIGTDRHRYSASIGAEFMTFCMSPDGSDNGVLTFRDDYNYIDENSPLRASMIVYLKMQEAT